MIIRKAEIKDLKEIADIYNHAILNLTATFDEEVKSLQERREWFEIHQDSRYPLLVVQEEKEIVGWGSISQFKPRAGYRFTGETSIYVRHDKYGNNIGSLLLEELINLSKKSGLHCLMGIIVDNNVPSINLHAKYGFKIVGNYREVGFKFGRWLDVVVMQKIL
ncbi:MAG: GNAT family N-acetyltransferase [Bacillota bacterium]